MRFGRSEGCVSSLLQALLGHIVEDDAALQAGGGGEGE